MSVYYRDLLLDKFNQKKDVNLSYSLRQFSIDCGLPANRMSDVLNERYGISQELGETVCGALGIEGYQKKLFLLSVESEHARSKAARDIAQSEFVKLKGRPDRIITDEEFRLIYDWKTIAILELMRHPHFNHDLKWLAEKLRMGIVETIQCIDKLVEVGCVVVEAGEYRVDARFFSTASKAPSETIQNYHKQVLKMSVDAIENQDFNERDMSSITFMCSKSRLDRIKEKIKKFRFELATEFNSNDEDSDLYVLNVQFIKGMSETGRQNQ